LALSLFDSGHKKTTNLPSDRRKEGRKEEKEEDEMGKEGFLFFFFLVF